MADYTVNSSSGSYWSFSPPYFNNSTLTFTQGSSRVSFSAPSNTAVIDGNGINGGFQFRSYDAGTNTLSYRWSTDEEGFIGPGPNSIGIYSGHQIRRSGNSVGTFQYGSTSSVEIGNPGLGLPFYTLVTKTVTLFVGFNQTITFNQADGVTRTVPITQTYIGKPLNVRLALAVRENSTGRNFSISPNSGAYVFSTSDYVIFQGKRGGALFFGHNF